MERNRKKSTEDEKEYSAKKFFLCSDSFSRFVEESDRHETDHNTEILPARNVLLKEENPDTDRKYRL